MNPIASTPIAEQLQHLQSLKQPCPADHPFLKTFHLSGGHHSQITALIGDVECQDSYVRAIRSADGQFANAVVFTEPSPGVFEQLYVNDRFALGSYVLAGGKLEDGGRIYVTVDVPSAVHLTTATGECAVATLHPQNLEPVCLALRQAFPNIALVLALDWTDGGSGQDPRALPLVRELSYKLNAPYVTSGEAGSFTELARLYGKSGVSKRVEAAEVPEAGTALGGACAQTSIIPAAAIAASFPQNGSGLLRDLVAAVHRAVVTSEPAALAIALWILFTHVFRSFTIAPLLILSSPELRCGKTNALTLLLRLVFAPMPTSDLTEASIYRAIEMWRPTLLIDEADTFMVGNKKMTGIINSGYKLATGRVLRTNKRGVEPLNTFGPKAIALIGGLSETLMDRAIHIRLARKLPSETVQTVKPHGPDDLTMLQARIVRWADDHRDELASKVVPRIEGINDRANDNAAPLLAIASACSGAWAERASHALKALAEPEDQSLSISTQLLIDIRHAFEQSQTEQLPTVELLNHLNSQEEGLWPTYSRGREMTARDLADLLGRYGIKSYQFRNADRGVVRGYAPHQFADAFKRYLP